MKRFTGNLVIVLFLSHIFVSQCFSEIETRYWISTHGDCGSSRSSNESIKPPLKLLWERKDFSGRYVIAAEGLVFAAGALKDEKSGLYAFDAATGEKKWCVQGRLSHDLGVANCIYDKGRIYSCIDGSLLALQAKSGEVIWKSDKGEYDLLSPFISKNVILAICDCPPPDDSVGIGREIQVFELNTGKLLWKYRNNEGFADIVSGEGLVFFLENDSRWVGAFEEKTGKVVWRREDLGIKRWGVFSPCMSYSDGLLYVREGQTSFHYHRGKYGDNSSPTQKIFCLRGKDGQLVWKRGSLPYSDRRLAIHNGIIYLTSGYNQSYISLDGKTGSIIYYRYLLTTPVLGGWTAGIHCCSSATYVGGILYKTISGNLSGKEHRTILAMDAKNFEPLWIGGNGNCSGVIVAEGRIFTYPGNISAYISEGK